MKGSAERLRCTERGFSMLEVLIVIGVILIITVVALPSLIDASDEYRLTAVAGQVVGNLNNARIRAINRNDDYRMTISSTTRYTLQAYVSSTWTTEDSYDLPAGFTIGTNGTLVEFHARGNATPYRVFQITNPNGDTKDVIVELSGRIHAQ